MKYLIVMIMIALTLLSGAVAAKEYFYYDLDGSHITLPVCDSLVTIKFDPYFPIQLMNDFPSWIDALKDHYSPSAAGGSFYQFGVEPGFSIDSAIAILLQQPEVDYVTPVFVAEDTTFYFAGDQIVLRFRESLTALQAETLIDQYGLQVLRAPDSLSYSYLLAQTDNSERSIFDLCNQLYESGSVYYSYPDLFGFIWFPLAMPDDPYFSYWQWNLYHDASYRGKPGADIDMDKAWNYSDGRPGTVVAIIDAAFDLDHEDLDLSKMWAPFDAGGTYEESLGFHVPDYDPRLPPDDWKLLPYYWHGTACLGLICPVTDNGVGIAGITSDNIYFTPIKMVDDNLGTDLYVQEWAWRHCINASANVVSVSIGYWKPIPSITMLIKEGYEKGIGYACAAGNNKKIVYPASLPYVMAVGGTDPYDNVCGFSGRGDSLDIVAPAESLTTLDVTGANGYQNTTNSCQEDMDYYCGFTGTSAAAPQVAAVMALVLSRNPDLTRDTTAEPLYNILRGSADDGINVNDPPGYDTTYGYGRLNAYKALVLGCTSCGDANSDGIVDISDVVFILAHIFTGGAAPADCRYRKGMGDANGDGSLDISDCVFLIARIFAGGATPHCQGM